MSARLTLKTTVAYGDVDRREVMLLTRVFKMLQDAAIAHANQFGAGTQGIVERAETWVLSRIVAELERYPKVGEELAVETWSTGIKGFKGYREFRVTDAQGRQLLTGSSLWIYFNLATKTITRVPKPIAERFPVGEEKPWCADLEKLPFEEPASIAALVPITLRYSDFDVNEHVNNASYFDLVQTALASSGRPVYSRRVQLKYGKAIPAGAQRVDVRVEPQDGGARFAIEGDGAVYAVGAVAGEVA
jgi:acyl-ACP thioesterase